ncbi:MAG: hypothetical protein JNM17_09605 [Archangium sp.]|nr:hypothetical protein [Archangium sp.]
MNKNALLISLLALTACPPPLTPTPLEKAPRITSFTASASLVNAGDTVTLSWATEDATEVTLVEASLGAVSGVDGLSGSVTVAVPKNSLFIHTARNERGATHRAVVGVSVREAMGDVLLTAMPTEIDVGQSVTLAWSAPGATDLTLSANPGGPITTGAQLESGLVTVTPTANTTYTLTSGARTASVSVTVRATLLTFTASTDAIDPTDGGAQVTLSWTTANAARVRLTTPGRATLHDSADAGQLDTGSFTDTLPAPIDPSRLFRYDLQVEGNGASITRSLTLPVRGNPNITSLTAPRYAKAGGPVTIAWTTTGADSFSLFDGESEIHRSISPVEAASGSVVITAPNANVTFEGVARGARAGETRQSVEIEVVGTPSLTLATSPATFTRGQPFQITWNGQSVRNLKLYSSDARLLYSEADTTDTGTVPVTFYAASPVTYFAVADNALGEVTTASIAVAPSNPFTVTRSPSGSVQAGQRVTLSWASGETLHGFPHDDVTVRPMSTGFDDISVTGTRLMFATTDDDFLPIVTTFRAPFFGRIVGDQITVSTNGYITFGPVDKTNYVEVPLPSAKMEPWSIVVNWDDLTTVSAWWQLKTVGSDQVLIVQWASGSGTTARSFQLKLFSTGQIDFEYGTMSGTLGTAGIQGPRGDEGVLIGMPVATGLGVTFFTPKQSPLTFVARSRDPVRGFLNVGGVWSPVSTTLDVIHPEDLQLAEAQLEPSLNVGANGRWLEFVNNRDTAIDLSGWAITLPDAGMASLSGSVASKATRVFGVSTDRALNDDAGVDVALTGFDVSGQRDSFIWGQSAASSAFGSLTWNNPTTGFAQVSDFGPYRFAGDATATPNRPQTCAATAPYGSQLPPQRGTPGADVTCGFGYRWQRVSPGYYDVSAFGTRLIGNVTTSGVQANVDLSAHPFRFFGVNRNGVRLSADGYLTFDLTAANNVFSATAPETTAPNSVLAIYADDMGGRFADSGVFVHRAVQGEDPWAAPPHWIFQWHRWSHSTDDDLNFEVKLFDDGTIEYHFATMVSGSTTTPYSSGITANTWLENGAGSQALVINASSVTPGISPFTAFRFSPR